MNKTQITKFSKKYSKASNKSAFKVSRRVKQTNGILNALLFLLKAFILAFFGFIILFPFYYMISMSLMTLAEIIGIAPLFPSNPQLGNYASAMNNGFWEAFVFSTSVLVVNIMLKLIVCILLGYAFGNYNFRFKNTIWWLFMLTLTIPEVALISGQYNVIIQTGMNRGLSLLVGLCAPYVASVFTAYMFRIAFESIPTSVKEAAMIDGISGSSYFFKVAIPMISGTIWTVVILTTFASWNSYMWPALVLTGSDLDTIPLWLFNVGRPIDESSQFHTEWQMAGSVLATIPTVIIYFLFKNKINAVVAGGANKG